jgi:hypothetical protein
MANYTPTSDLQAELPSVLRSSLDTSVLRRRLDEMEDFVFSSIGQPPPGNRMVKAIIRDLALARFLERVDSDRASTLEENTLAWLERFAKNTSFPSVDGAESTGAATSGFYSGNIYEDELWPAGVDTISGHPWLPLPQTVDSSE